MIFDSTLNFAFVVLVLWIYGISAYFYGYHRGNKSAFEFCEKSLDDVFERVKKSRKND